MAVSLEAAPQPILGKTIRPTRVSQKLTVTQGAARILSVVDGQMDEKTGRFPSQNQVINITYDFSKGVLSDKIKVATSKP